MSSEKFEDLEDELKALHEDISSKITNKIPRLTGGKLNNINSVSCIARENF